MLVILQNKHTHAQTDRHGRFEAIVGDNIACVLDVQGFSVVHFPLIVLGHRCHHLRMFHSQHSTSFGEVHRISNHTIQFQR